MSTAPHHDEPLGTEEARERMIATLKRTIVGQDEALRAIATACHPPEQDGAPAAKVSFLFAGEPGVGKTAMAEAIATFFAGQPLRLDMACYPHQADGRHLLPNPDHAAYLNGSRDGVLLDALTDTPPRLPILEEIDKAHPALQKAIDTVLGRAPGDATVIATTSGAECPTIDPGLLLRFTRVTLGPLRDEDLRDIAARRLDTLAAVLAGHGITLVWDDAVPGHIAAEHTTMPVRVRGVFRALDNVARDAAALCADQPPTARQVRVSVRDGALHTALQLEERP